MGGVDLVAKKNYLGQAVCICLSFSPERWARIIMIHSAMELIFLVIGVGRTHPGHAHYLGPVVYFTCSLKHR